jgi:PTH1 family peptidyl-tRNA hydrolase
MVLDHVQKEVIAPRFSETDWWISCEGTLAGHPVVLLRPSTYVNLSGEAISRFLLRTSIGLDRMLVVCDDVALPFGRIRIRPKGGDGGHNGLGSLIEHLHTEEFGRLRVGIGPGPSEADLADFVLDAFDDDELSRLSGVIERAARGVETFVLGGLEEAMNRFNVPDQT